MHSSYKFVAQHNSVHFGNDRQVIKGGLKLIVDELFNNDSRTPATLNTGQGILFTDVTHNGLSHGGVGKLPPAAFDSRSNGSGRPPG